MGPTTSKAESLGVCQWVRTEISKVLAEMDPMVALKEETLLLLLETESETGKGRGNGIQGASFLCRTKTRTETTGPMVLVEVTRETKMEADGNLGARLENW